MCIVTDYIKILKRNKELESENAQLKAQIAELTQPGVERPSPQGIILKDETGFNSDKFTISRQLIRMEPTGSDSMDPLFDKGDLVLGVEDFDRNNLIVGDIVVYHSGGGHYTVHRIVKITEDAQGRLYRLCGDNNANKIDPYLVRNEHIKYLVAGIVYLRKEA